MSKERRPEATSVVDVTVVTGLESRTTTPRSERLRAVEELAAMQLPVGPVEQLVEESVADRLWTRGSRADHHR